MNMYLLIGATLFFCQALSNTLRPLNRCLGNCAICGIDSLDTCSGSEMIQCIKGYDGQNCQLKPTMAVEVKLQVNKFHPLVIEQWDNDKTTVCSYNHKNGSEVEHITLGLFQGQMETKAIIQMNQNYQNFIFTFNLVRSTWTPFSDLLKIVLTDQNGKQLKQGFIQYVKREQLDSSVNLLKCGQQSVITEKFEVDYVEGFQKIKELHIKFESFVISGKWGITNARLAFGCNNFLIYEGNSCSKCLTGYHKRFQNDLLIGCSICPASCKSCTSQTDCTNCLDGFTLKDGACVASKHLVLITRPVPSTFFVCNDVELRMSSFQSSSSTYSVIGPIEFNLPPHEEIRIIIQIAHTIPKEDRESHSEQFFLQLDNSFVLDMTVLESVQKPVGYCPGFANGGKINGQSGVVNGFYAWTKIATPLMEYRGQNITIKIRSSNEKYFGIARVLFEVNERQDELEPAVQIPTEPIVQDPETEQNQNDNEEIDLETPENKTQPLNNQTNDENNETIEPTIEPAIDPIDNQLIETIEQISDMKQQILVDIKSDPYYHFSIKYPKPFNKKPYIYLKLKGQSQIIVPTVVRETSTYQIFKVDLGVSLIQKELQIYMSPQQVREEIQKESNRRILEEPTKLTQNFQEIMTQLKTIEIRRFDALLPQQISSLATYSQFFEVISWIVIIVTIILAFFGNSVITQELSLLIQIIFLYVYIDSAYLPHTFQLPFKGLMRMQSLNYFTQDSITKIETWLLGNVIQESPLRFTMYQVDVNFTRRVYPCLIIILILVVWFIILSIIRKVLTKNLVVEQDQQLSNPQKLKFFIIRISERILNFWYQIWQYQYITWVWAGLIQLHNLSYPEDADRNSVINSIFCFLALILFLALPFLTTIYLNKKYFKLDYFQYCYWYKDVFFMKLPSECLPSNHHRINIIVRNIRLFLNAIIIAFLGEHPVPACILLILLHFFSLIYTRVSHLQISRITNILSMVQHIGLILLTILVLIAYGVSGTLGTKQYNVIGHVMVVIGILLIINGIIRALYYCYQKYRSQTVEDQLNQFKPAIGTERVV